MPGVKEISCKDIKDMTRAIWRALGIHTGFFGLRASMSDPTGYPGDLWTIPLYFLGVVVTVGLILLISAFLGGRHREHDTDKPYEGGMPITGTTSLRFDIQFYIIAMIFLVFDIETIFIMTWAVAGKELGWPGYIEIAVFIILLLAALVYLIRVGALTWRRRYKRRAGGTNA